MFETHDAILALLCGLSSGVLSIGAQRRPALGWVALAPLALAMHWCPPPLAAAGAAVTGVLGSVSAVTTPTLRPLIPKVVAYSLVGWPVAFGAASFALQRSAAVLSLLLLPAAAVAVLLPLRIAGAPRWIFNFLARSQEPWLPVVHAARLGGDAAVTALLALASAALALAIVPEVEHRSASLLASIAFVAGALTYGMRRYRAAIDATTSAPRLRVAAVVADEPLAQHESRMPSAQGSDGALDPGPLEPSRKRFMHPGPFTVQTRSRVLSLSVAICADIDYADLIAPVRAVGGVLLVPSNDWPEFERLHHRTAVWSAALSGVPVVRATGHGTSALFDGAGRVVNSQVSWEGAVVMLIDVPLAAAAADEGG